MYSALKDFVKFPGFPSPIWLELILTTGVIKPVADVIKASSADSASTLVKFFVITSWFNFFAHSKTTALVIPLKIKLWSYYKKF